MIVTVGPADAQALTSTPPGSPERPSRPATAGALVLWSVDRRATTSTSTAGAETIGARSTTDTGSTHTGTTGTGPGT